MGGGGVVIHPVDLRTKGAFGAGYSIPEVLAYKDSSLKTVRTFKTKAGELIRVEG